MPSDPVTAAHREADCQRHTAPQGGCNEYAAPCGQDDLINNNKLSPWPGLLGAALCARANGLETPAGPGQPHMPDPVWISVHGALHAMVGPNPPPNPPCSPSYNRRTNRLPLTKSGITRNTALETNTIDRGDCKQKVHALCRQVCFKKK